MDELSTIKVSKWLKIRAIKTATLDLQWNVRHPVINYSNITTPYPAFEELGVTGFNHVTLSDNMMIHNNNKTALNFVPSDDSICSSSYYKNQAQSVILSHMITTNLTILIILVGLIMNSVGMIIFRSKNIIHSSVAIYLFSLALSDNIYLIMVFLTRSLEGIQCLYSIKKPLDFYHTSNIACKGLQYILDIASDFSVCLILIMTIERYIACYHCVWYKKNCTVKRAKHVTISLAVSISILIAPHHLIFIGSTREYTPLYNLCVYFPKYSLLFDYFYMTESLIFRVIPAIAIAVLNSLIVSKLWNISKMKRQRYNSVPTSLIDLADRRQSENPQVAQSHKDGGSGGILNSTNITLVFISTFYIICFTPILVCYILSKLAFNSVITIPINTIYLFRNYSRTLYICSYALNLCFYVLTGKRFKEELVRMFCQNRLWWKCGDKSQQVQQKEQNTTE